MRFEILKLESLEQLRMAPFNCNDSRNTAYSVCWDWGLIHLHAHVDNESLSFYNLVPQGRHAMWLYMPMNKDEYISQIWGRPSRTALLVSTIGLTIF